MRRSASSSRAWQKRDSCTPRSYSASDCSSAQVAFLELLDDRFELGDRGFEILDRGVGHRSIESTRRTRWTRTKIRLSVPRSVVSVSVAVVRRRANLAVQLALAPASPARVAGATSAASRMTRVRSAFQHDRVAAAEHGERAERFEPAGDAPRAAPSARCWRRAHRAGQPAVGADQPRADAGEPAAEVERRRAAVEAAGRRRSRAARPARIGARERVRQLGGVAAAHRDAAGEARRTPAGRSATCTRRLSAWTRPRAAAAQPVAQAIDAAAELVLRRDDELGGRRRRRRAQSATKSAIVTSVSWPTAEITGTGDRAIARATISSLNAQRSSIDPPPRPTMTTSTPGTRAIAAAPRAISSAAPSPCTRAGRMTRCAFAIPAAQHLDDVANRRAVERRHDADLARQRRQRTLARRVEQPFGLQPLLQLIERELQRAEARAARGARRRADTRPSARRPRSCRARRRAGRRPA